ncbi:MAG: hypothetical protein HYT37_00025 [Candidatus Sungbacteria bacterium]|nr:hypothetical protein [Candidatus Sungbacteria bacterium]
MLKSIGLFLVVFFLTACGDPVEVPPAHVGKLSTPSGLQEGIIPPSKLRLDSFCITCDSLILVEASDYPIKEVMPIFIPKDTLNLTVEVRGTVSISAEEQNVEKVFDRVSAESTNNERVKVIQIETVYAVYGQPVVREVARSIVTQYDIAHILQNRDAISAEITNAVREKLKDSPLTLPQFGLADIQPPPVIVAAQEAAKEREIAINRAEAEKQIKLKEAEAAYEVAIKQQQVDLKEAETQVLVEKKLAESVSTAFVTQRSLKVLEQLANSENKVFFLPTEAMKNPAIMMGIVNDGFAPKKTVVETTAKTE